MNETTTTATTAEQLRDLAGVIESNPQARNAIGAGFRLIADAMDRPPCEDCGSTQGQALDPADNPETGADAGNGQHLADTPTGQLGA